MTPDPDAGEVKSDATLLAILEELKENEHRSLTDIAGELGLANSTVYAHLSTLEDHGFVHSTEDGYCLGLRFLDYGVTARDRRFFYRVSKDLVDELAEETNERVWCIIEEHGRAVYLYGARGSRSIRTRTRIGQHTDLHHLAAGKAILSQLPRSRVEDILDRNGLTAFTPQTITDAGELYDELAEVRESGVAFNLEESIEGLHAVGAPITDAGGGVYGAISVSGPANRLTERRLADEYADLLRGYANEIELNTLDDEYRVLSR